MCGNYINHQIILYIVVNSENITRYYDKIIDTEKAIQSITYEEKQRIPGMTFEQLVSEGNAIPDLKVTGQGMPPDGIGAKGMNKKKIEINFIGSDIDLIEASNIKEGLKVTILVNKQLHEKFNPKDNDLRGTVTIIEDNKITIESEADLNFKAGSDLLGQITMVIYDDQNSTLEIDNLKNLKEGYFCEPSLLSSVIDADSNPEPGNDNIQFRPIDNETAVSEALKSKNLYFIHGPPGTGKTVTCAQIISRFIIENPTAKVLVTAQSNKAVDNLLLHLSRLLPEPEKKITRIGRSFKLMEGCSRFTIQQKVKNEFSKKIMRLELKDYFIRKNREQTRVYFCTPAYIQMAFSLKDTFDLVIVDESSTITESSCLIPFCRARKVIMAGDYKQLGPHIRESKKENDPRNEKIKSFEKTLFEKLMKKNPEKSGTLKQQHRMHQILINFSNDTFYGGVLESDENVKYSDLPIFFNKPIIFINHNGLEEPGKGTSFYNEIEADIVSKLVKKYYSLGIDNKMMGVISFYKSQKLLINRLIRANGIDEVKCMTVDSYQGEEKNIIILSTVRSNDIKEPKISLGFLTDYCRLNVSLTRAKNKLIIIGNKETLERDPVTKKLLNYILKKGVFLEAKDLDKAISKPKNPDYEKAINEKKTLALGAYQAKLEILTKADFEDSEEKAKRLAWEDNFFSGMDGY